MRVTRSFSLDLRTIEKLQDMNEEYKEIGKSKFIDDLIFHYWVSWLERQDSSGQTTLDIHYGNKAHREARNDGKCNPHLKHKPCPTCYPQGVA